MGLLSERSSLLGDDTIERGISKLITSVGGASCSFDCELFIIMLEDGGSQLTDTSRRIDVEDMSVISSRSFGHNEAIFQFSPR